MDTGKKLKEINDAQFEDINYLKEIFKANIDFENSKGVDNLRLGQAPSEIDYSKIAREVGYGDSSYDSSIESPDELFNLAKHRHEEQPWYASLGASGLQTATTLVGQTMEGIGYLLDGEQWVNMAKGVEKEYNNWFSQLGKDLQEAGREIAPIYTDPDKEGDVNLGDWTYWMSNLPTIASTLSFFIPATGVVKAASLLGRGMQAAGMIGKVSKVASGLAKGLIGGITSRVMEGAMESSALHQEFMQMSGQQLTMEEALKIEKEYGVSVTREVDDMGTTRFFLSPEAVQEAGAKAAARNFNANMALLLTDIPQFMLAMNPYGKVTEKLTGKLAQKLGKSSRAIVARNMLEYGTQMATEGFEEGYQYISAERNKDIELARMGLIDETDFNESVGKAIEDGEFYTSMIFGALGAGVMQAASKGINKLINKGKLTTEDLRLQNVDKWNASMKQYSDRLRAAEANNNPLEYDAVTTEMLIDKLIEDAEVGNLGYSLERINDIANATAEEQGQFGMDSEDITHIKQKLPKIVELAARVEESYQNNLNETGNRTMASLLTKHDLLTTEYNKIYNEADKQVSNIINDTNSWSNPISDADVTAFAKAQTILNQANAKKIRLEQEKKDSLKDGVATFRTRQIETSLKVLDDFIKQQEDVITDVKSRKPNVAKETKKAKLSNEASNNLKKAAINVVNSIVERDYHSYYSDFYRSSEGKELFKKENYKVIKKKIKDALKNAETVEDLEDAKEVVKNTEFEDTIAEAEEETVNTPTTPKKTTQATTNVVEEVEPVRGELGELDALLAGEISTPTPVEQAQGTYKDWQEGKAFDGMSGLYQEVTAKAMVNSLKQENNPLAPELEDVLDVSKKDGTLFKERWNTFMENLFTTIALGEGSTDTDVIEAANNAKKALDTINFHINQRITPKTDVKTDATPVQKADQVTSPNTNKALRVNRSNNGNMVFVGTTENGIVLNNTGVDIDIVDFNIPIGSEVYIVKRTNQGNATPEAGNVFYDIVYYTDSTKKNKKLVGAIPLAGKGKNAAQITALRKALDAHFATSTNNTFPHPMVLSGYRGEYQYKRSGTPEYNKPSEAPAKGKKGTGALQKAIDAAGGFLVGVVRGKTVGDSRRIEFPNMESIPGIPVLEANDSTTAESRRKISLSTVKEVGGNWRATYIKPHDPVKLISNNPGKEYNQLAIDTYGETIDFKSKEEALKYIQEEYNREMAGNIFIIVPNPMKPDEALHIRAFSMTIGELAKKRKDVHKEIMTNLFTALINTTGTPIAIIKSLRELVRITRLDAIKLNNYLVESFKDDAERLQFLKGVLNGDTMPDTFAQIINSADIITDASQFNTPQYDKATVLGDKPAMPYNNIIDDVIGVTTKAGRPMDNASAIVDFSSVFNQPVKPVPVPKNNPEVITKEGKAPVQGTVKENPPIVSAPTEVVKTTAPVPDIEAKKVDIERRKQEEKNQYSIYDLSLPETNESSYLSQGIKKLGNSALEALTPKEYNQAQKLIRAWINSGLTLEEVAQKLNERFDVSSISPGHKEIFAERANIAINAKYDAELAALTKKDKPATTSPETPPANKAVVSSIKNKIGGKIKPKLFQSTSTEVTPNSKEELDWFRKAFPNIPIKDLQEIADMVREVTSQGATAWGAFYNAAIYMREHFPEGTVYHEAFHVLFNLALNENEKNTLLAKAQGKDLIAKEEWLAEKFKEVILTGKANTTDKSIKGYITKILNKLGLFIRSVVKADIKNLEELAYRVNRGKYKKLNANTFNTPQLRLYKTVPGWGYDKAVRAVDTINRFIVTDLIPNYRSINKLDGISDAEVLTHYIKAHGNNPLSIYREMAASFEEVLNDADSGLTQEQATNLRDLVDKMFPSDGELNLIISAIEELGNNHNMVLTVKGIANEAVTVMDYYQEMSLDKETSEVYDVNFITKSNKNDASSRVKTAIRYLETGYSNEFGLPEYFDYDETYNTLLKDLEGSLSTTDIMNKLAALQTVKPHYETLYDRMEEDNAFATDMLQAFNRAKMNYYIMTEKDGKYYIFDSTRSGVVNRIKEQWSNNFYRGTTVVKSNINTGQTDINKELATKLYNEYTELAKRFLVLPKDSAELDSIANQLADILKEMTIELSPETLLYSKKNVDEGKLTSLLSGRDNSISSILKAISEGINPYEITADSNYNVALGKIASVVKDSMPELYELSHMTVGGEKAYSHIIPTFLTNFINRFKNIVTATQLVEQYKQDPLFYSNGTFYNPILAAIDGALKQPTDNLKQDALNDIFNVGVMTGYNIGGDKIPYVEMQDYDLKMVSINSYHNNGSTKKGMFRLPPLSDSGNMLIMEFDKLNYQQSINYLLRIATGEYNRIINLGKKKEGSNTYANYDNARNASTKTGYSIMPMMNGFEQYPSDNKVKAQKRIDDFFTKEADIYYNNLVDTGVIVLDNNGNISLKDSNIDSSILLSKDARSETDRTNPKAMKLFIKEMLMNDFIARTSISLMTIGDPAFYSEKTKEETVTVNRIVDYFKRAKEIFSPKTNPDINAKFQPRDSRGNPVGKEISVRSIYRALYLRDENIVAPSFAEIVSFLEGELKAGRINQQKFDSLKDAYSRVNHTDAQAFITAEFYRETMIAHGLWDDRKQAAYDKLQAGIGTADDLVVMQPIKPYMFNNIFDETRNIMVPVQHKNSEYVIFKQFTDKNPKLKALHDYMLDNNISIANFESAVKTGLTNVATLEEISNGVIPKVQEIPMSDRGIQMATPEHHIDSVIKEGTQMRAISFSDMNPDSEYRINGEGKSMKSGELRNAYLNLLEANLKESFNDVKDMFYENGKFNWKLVQDVLYQEAVSRGLPDDFQSAIKYNESTGRLNLPVFDPVFNERMESLFTSIMRNRITRQTVAGAALIQASSVGLSKDLKLIFKDDVGNLVESEKTITFDKIDAEVRQALEDKGYTSEMWDTLTEEEKNHAIKCSKV